MTNQFKLDGFLRRLSLPAALAAVLASALPVSAKEYDPYIMYAFPAGGQRGTTIETMARGRGLEGSTEVRISGPGITAKVLAIEEPSAKLRQRSANRQDQAENPNVVRISVTIAPDAPLGQRDLRVITPKGATNRFRFIVGQIPEINEVEPNSLKSEAQTIEALPVTINGQANQADRDIFRFQAKAGETIVCDLLGRKIMPFVADGVPGWLQASLALYDADGKELAYVDDFRFHPDPLLIYEIEKDGQYLIETRDVLFRGREDFVYRLNIGTLPYLTHVFPLGGVRNADARIELHGVNLSAKTVAYNIPADSPPLRYVESIQNGLASNPLPLAVDNLPEGLVVSDGALSPGQNQIRLTVTAAADAPTAVLSPTIRAAATIGDKTLVREAIPAESATQAFIWTFDVPTDEFLLAVIRPDSYALSSDVPTTEVREVEQGSKLDVVVKASREEEAKAAISLLADKPPGGITVSRATIAADKNEATLTITVASNAAVGLRQNIIINGTMKVDKETVTCVLPAIPIKVIAPPAKK